MSQESEEQTWSAGAVPPILIPPAPPITGPAPDPYPEEKGRYFTGWIALGLLILLTILSSFGESVSPSSVSALNHEDLQDVVQSVLQNREATFNRRSRTAEAAKKQVAISLKRLEKELPKLAAAKPTDLMARKLAAVIETELGKPVDQTIIRILQGSNKPVDRVIAEIYSAKSLSMSQAKNLTALLPDYPPVYKAIKVQAYQRAGDNRAVLRFVHPQNSSLTSLAGIGGIIVLVLGYMFGAQYLRQYQNGTLRYLGLPLNRITLLDADRLAVRAAQIFALYLGMETGASFLPKDLFNNFLRIMVVIVGMASGVILLQNNTIEGKKISLASMGVNARNWKNHVGFGVIGFLIEFPIAMALAAFGTAIFAFLPKATHPASEAIARDHSLGTVVPVMLLGCVLAPFWEELVFRGLLLPAFTRMFKGIRPGIFLSSFLFASMHPQGISLWFSLAAVGAASCLLSIQTKSLIPSMVMHCLHNLTVFTIALMYQS